MAEQFGRLAVVLISAILAFLVIKPFITALIFAAVIAYLLYPLHLNISKKIGYSWSCLILTIASAAIVIAIIAYGTSILLNEVSKAYMFISKLNIQYYDSAIGDTLKNLTRILFSKIIEGLSNSITSIPKVLLTFMVFFISLFYFLKDGQKLVDWARSAMPLESEAKNQIIKTMQKYTHAYFYVWALIALLQGIVAALGFYIFSVPYIILGALSAAVLSFLPVIGPYALYVPVGLTLVLSGEVNAGLGLMVYGLGIGSVLDYVARPYLAGKKAQAHPLIILVGLLGGLALIGPAGIIVGPIILICAITMLSSISSDAQRQAR